MNWLHYLAEANIYLGVFYLAYCVFLTKETHYQLNRGYLLFSCIMSFALPVLQVGALKPAEPVAITTSYIVPQDYIPTQITAPITITPVVEEHHLTTDDYLWYAYIIGAGVLLIVLAIKLYTLFKLIRNAQRIKQDKYKLVYLPETDVAFSFFNYLFIGNNAPGANTIITHELVHIRQRHSVDIIFLEVLKVVSWFNPFIYLLQNSLKTVHEYIADEQTATYESDALAYSSFLVNNAYGAGGSSITHSFFNYNLLKKRIIMLNQQRSGNLARLKYLVALPVFIGLLCTSTLAFSKTYGFIDLDPAKTVTAIKAAVINPKPSPQTPAKVISSPISKIEPIKGKLIIVDGKIVHPKADETISADSMVDISANTPSADGPDVSNRLTSDLINYLSNNIRFPKYALTENFVLTFKTSFTVADNKITDITMVRETDNKVAYTKKPRDPNLSDEELKSFETEILKVLPTAPADYIKPGRYNLPVAFLYKKDNELFQVVNNMMTKTATGSLLLMSAPVIKAVKKPSGDDYNPTQTDWQNFGRDLARNVKYTVVDIIARNQGKVIALFAVDADHNIQYIKVVRTPSYQMSGEVIRSLKINKYLSILKPGVQYVVPVEFTLGSEDGSPVGPPVVVPDDTKPDLSRVIYNPNNIDIADVTHKSLMLNDVVIRGYIKKP